MKIKEPYERYMLKKPRKETEVTFQCFARAAAFPVHGVKIAYLEE